VTRLDRPGVTHHASGALDFVDKSGTSWTVTEIARLDFSEQLMALLPHPERRRGWLLFESTLGERRRYTPIPESWRELPVSSLEECLANAAWSSVIEQRRREDRDR